MKDHSTGTMHLCETIAHSSTDHATSSATYTPQKKKQKTDAGLPPRAPSKNKRIFAPWTELEESRCELEQHRVATQSFVPDIEQLVGVEGRTHNDTKTRKPFQLTLATHWDIPLNPVSRNKRLVQDMEDDGDQEYYASSKTQVDVRRDDMGRTSSLDGLELLEMMSFDEEDGSYQGGSFEDDDDVSLSYSIASEG